MPFRVMRFNAPPVAPPSAGTGDAAADRTAADVAGGEREIGRPTAESQQAGIDHLARIAAEQAAAGHQGIPAQTATLRINAYYSG